MIKSFSVTDIGRKRKLNQDFVYSSDETVGNLKNVYIVADGMGGHQAGDYASKCTVETMVREIKGCFEQSPIRILSRAIRIANDQVRRKAREDESLYGMGTTVVAATVLGKYLQVANVGDSRLYIINEEVRQITRDHTLVEEMVRMGGLDREAARNHPDKNIITRAIGAKADVDVDFYEHRLKRGDIILMCTDGLSNMVEDEELFHIVQGARDIVEAGQNLVNAAKENGGTDNIGIVLIEPFADEVSI